MATAAVHNEYLAMLGKVAGAQGCKVLALAEVNDRVIVLLQKVLGLGEKQWRVTSYNAGMSEFGQGYYYSSEAAARRHFAERLTAEGAA